MNCFFCPYEIQFKKDELNTPARISLQYFFRLIL
jgi:hypothetical protein